MQHHSCPQCGKSFQAREIAKFCSNACRSRHRRVVQGDIVARARAAGIW